MSDASESQNHLPDEMIANWVNHVLPKALAYTRSLIRDPHAAEDIVHDCICRLIAKRDRYDLSNDGFKLLLRSISNAVIDRIRKSEPRLLDTQEFNNGYTFEPIDQRAIDPSNAILQKELELAIDRGLKNLPVKQRAALELKSFGLAIAEIAESLEITESNAGVLIYRARVAMAKELADWLKVEP